MKKYFMTCMVLCITFLCNAQDERDIIKRIDSINNTSLNFYRNNDFASSIKSIEKAIKLSDSIADNYGNAIANFNLGNVYFNMQEPLDALRCYKRMLHESKKINDNYLLASSYFKIGEVYNLLSIKDSVIPFYQNALQYAKKKDVRDQNNLNKKDEVLLEIHLKLAEFMLNGHEPDQALIYLLRADNNLSFLKPNVYYESYLNYLYAQFFDQKNNLFKAISKYDEALSTIETSSGYKDLRIKRLQANIYQSYALLHDRNSNFEQAYILLAERNTIANYIAQEEKLQLENISKNKIHLIEYKRLAELAEEEKRLQEAATAEMKRINIIVSIAVILLFLSMLFLIKNFLSKRKINRILEARNKQLEFSKNEAEKSSKLKSSFISKVTHELRTPLYGVVGISSLLLKSKNLGENELKYVKSLKFSGDYLLSLVNDILQVGKIETEELQVQESSFSIRRLIDNIIDSFEFRTVENNNQIRLEIDNSIPEYIKSDKVRLAQILNNLIGNSVKFTKNGKIDVRIQLVNQIDDQFKLKFSIKDNGPGIEADKHHLIFENFTQISNENMDYQGTGLGLPIAKKLVNLLGGEIELVSELGQGSEFSFEIEATIAHSLSNDNPNLEEQVIPLERKYKVLVAEDNKINQVVTRNILQKGNYECVIVDNGLQAVNELKENDYDLILMDLNMPVMNGMEATKEIRQFDHQTPIIALTAADIEEVKTNFSLIGFNDIMTKPFDNVEFYQKINLNIDNASQLDEAGQLLSYIS